jgi:hypothetical protein
MINFNLKPFAVVALGAALLKSASKCLFNRQTCNRVPHTVNIANIAGVQAVSFTTERNTSEGKPPNRYLCMAPTDPFFLVRNSSILYTQYSTIVLEDGTTVVVKSSAEVAPLPPHGTSLKHRTSADALSAAGAALVLNQALACPSMYIFFSLGFFSDTIQ